MKKFHYLFACGFLLLFACEKNNDNPCDAPSPGLTVEDKQVLVDLQGVAPENGYDMEYGPEGFTQGSGTTETFSGTTTSFTVDTLGIYDVYFRKKCSNGGNSDWVKYTINVDGTTTTCQAPGNLDINTYSFPPRFEWYGWSGNFYDVEYGPTGFTIGNGTRLRTNNEYITEGILHQGITYDFYVRANCGGNKFSAWSDPYSYYAAIDYNINVPCTVPTSLYAYRTSSNEISYTAIGHGSVSYEISISSSSSTLTSNILSTSSPNGGVYNTGGFSGTRYFWIRGKCDNNTFTSWATSEVQ